LQAEALVTRFEGEQDESSTPEADEAAEAETIEKPAEDRR